MRNNPFTWRSAEQMGNKEAQDAPEYRRAGQDCICDICGKEYRKHHRQKWGTGDFALELFQVCSGKWVKL